MSSHEDSPWFLEFLLVIVMYSFFIICFLLSIIYFNMSFFNLVLQYLAIAILVSATVLLFYEAYMKKKVIVSILARALRVRRSLAIALGIICIILVASLAETLVVLNGANQQNTNLQNQNRQLQAWLDGNETLLNQTQANNANLQKIVNLNESMIVWTENNIASREPFPQLVLGPYEYAGYVSVKISATADTSVELNYTFQSLSYTSQVDCGMNGTAIFPVMPSSFLTIGLHSTAGTRANWTWTYYY